MEINKKEIIALVIGIAGVIWGFLQMTIIPIIEDAEKIVWTEQNLMIDGENTMITGLIALIFVTLWRIERKIDD